MTFEVGWRVVKRFDSPCSGVFLCFCVIDSSLGFAGGPIDSCGMGV